MENKEKNNQTINIYHVVGVGLISILASTFVGYKLFGQKPNLQQVVILDSQALMGAETNAIVAASLSPQDQRIEMERFTKEFKNLTSEYDSKNYLIMQKDAAISTVSNSFDVTNEFISKITLKKK